MQPHGEGELDSLSDSRSGGMAEANREEVEDIADGSVGHGTHERLLNSQDDRGDLGQVGRPVVCPL
jgi:hypothetical protein